MSLGPRATVWCRATLALALALALGAAAEVAAQGAATGAPEIRLASGERAVVLAAEPARDGSAQRDVAVHRILAAPRSVYGVPGTHSMRIAYRMNCTTRQWFIREVLLYPDRALNGAPLRQIDLSSQSVTYPPLESDPLASAVFAAACTPMAWASGPTAPPAAAAAPGASLPAPAPAPAFGPGAPVAALPGTPPGSAPAVPATPEGASAAYDPTGGEPPPEPEVAPQVPPSAPGRDPGAGVGLPPPMDGGTVSITESRPFADLNWTLGTLSGLAHYAYTDRHTHRARGEALLVLSSLLSRHQQADGEPAAPDSALPWTMLRLAIERGVKDARAYERNAEAKAEFLRSSGLEEDVPHDVALMLADSRNKKALAGLRVEFHRRIGTDDYAIVFRGSAQAEDWANNLWLGLDLGGVEAPYYQRAREIVAQFRVERPRARIVLVGHSLGGGLAQHVGNQLRLHVVAFNSSPLPPSYTVTANKEQQDRTRVYSAVYKMRRLGIAAPDPVSIGAAWMAQRNLAQQLGARATQHLVRPVCTLARPDPDLSEEERAAFVEEAAAAMATPSILSKLGLLNQAVGELPHEIAVESLKADPLWAAAGRRHGLQVPLVGSRLLENAGRKTFAVQSGLLSAGEIGAQLLFRRPGALALNLGLKAAAFGVRATGVTLMQLHSMGRYMRGLQYVTLSDGFSDFEKSNDQNIRTKCNILRLEQLH